MTKRGTRLLVTFLLIASIAALAALLANALRDPSPLRVGTSPDAVWVFISTNKPSQDLLHGMLPITKRTMWSADAERIQSETRFRWRTNKLIAVRKTLYAYDTNQTVQRVTSDLELHWPL